MERVRSKETSMDFNDGKTYRLWNLCGCGCGKVVRNLFAQGHDMRVKGQKEKGR